MENDTTRSLEAKARARGLNIIIRQLGTKQKPSYCIIKRDGIELKPPMQIATSIRDAEVWLDENQAHPSNQAGRAFAHLVNVRRPMKLL